MFGYAIIGRKGPAERAVVRRADILLAAAVLLSAGALAFFLYFFNSGQTACAVVTQNGVEVGRLSLGTGDFLRVEAEGGGYNLIEVTNDGVRVSEADCRDQICVRQGTITAAGETIICLPHKLAVHLEGVPEAGPDVWTNQGNSPAPDALALCGESGKAED